MCRSMRRWWCMAFNVSFTNELENLPNDRELARILQEGFLNEMGHELVEAVGANDSLWPVDTGLSRTSFTYRLLRKGTAEIVNAQPYAEFVEENTNAFGQQRSFNYPQQPALKTLERAAPRALSVAERWVQREFDRLAGGGPLNPGDVRGL